MKGRMVWPKNGKKAHKLTRKASVYMHKLTREKVLFERTHFGGIVNKLVNQTSM